MRGDRGAAPMAVLERASGDLAVIGISDRDGEPRAEQAGGTAEEMGRFAQEILASYEARVSAVERIIETTHQMLEALRGQREDLLAQLREALARHASLRKRDFGGMMDEMLARQTEREAAVRRRVTGYLHEQRALASALRVALSPAGTRRIAEVTALLRGMSATQAGRAREIENLLGRFRAEHEEMAQALRGLLGNGGSLKAKDLKAALRTIRAEKSAGGSAGGGNGREATALCSAARIPGGGP